MKKKEEEEEFSLKDPLNLILTDMFLTVLTSMSLLIDLWTMITSAESSEDE
jgi:hypothetical protein